MFSETLVNRLKHILPSHISPAHNAFVPGRLISDSSLLANEFSNHIAWWNKGRKFLAALKLNMSKAFDRVSWKFLSAILRKMGVFDLWLQLLHQCYSIVSFAVLVNRSSQDRFLPQRGLRQSDPLSPYLFIIFLESLSCAIQNLDESNLRKGIKLSINSPSLSYVLRR